MVHNEKIEPTEETPRQVFFAAMDKDEVSFFQAKLKENPKLIIEKINLDQAAARGAIKTLKLFLDKTNFDNYELGSVLSMACTWNHLNMVQFLLDKFQWPQEVANLCFKRSMLVQVDIEISKLLLTHGAWAGYGTEQPLRNAIFLGTTVDKVKLLIENGADIHVMNDYLLLEALKHTVDYNSDKPLDFSICICLIDNGINIHASDEIATRYLIDQIIDLSISDTVNNEKLDSAYEFLSYLLKQNPDTDVIIKKSEKPDKTKIIIEQLQLNQQVNQTLDNKIYSYPKI